MSVSAISWVWQYSPYTGVEKVIHLALADSANDLHDHEIWARQSWIAAKANTSRETVYRWLAKAERDGFIRLVENNRTEGRPNRYQFLMPPSAALLWNPKEGRGGETIDLTLEGGETIHLTGCDDSSQGGETIHLTEPEVKPEVETNPTSSPSAPQDARDADALSNQLDEPQGDASGDRHPAAAPLSHQSSISDTVSEVIRITDEQYGDGKTAPMLVSSTRGKPPCDAPWTAGMSAEEVLAVIRLAVEFSERSHTVGGNRYENPFTQKAAKPIKRLLTEDKFSERNVGSMIQWVTQDEFWSPNVRTHAALREKMDQLRGARNRDIKKRQAIAEREEANKGDGTTEDWMIRSKQRAS
jgi:hypothetical protein